MAITLQESLRGLFYAPFYVALAHDAYAAEGVTVRFVPAPAIGSAATALLAGEIDVAWGGPMRVMQSYYQDPGLRPRELRRGGYPRSISAGWARGKARASSAGSCRRAVGLGQRGADALDVSAGRSSARRCGAGRSSGSPTGTMAENCVALLAGSVDVVQLFEPFVSSLLAEHGCHVWYAQASRGPTSYTTFYTRRSLLSERRDELRPMVRAIYRTQQWVAAASADAIAQVVHPYFPDVAPAIWRRRAGATGRWGSGGTIRCCRGPDTTGCCRAWFPAVW